MKNKYGETITKEFSKVLSASKRKLLKLESHRGKEWYISIFQNFLKSEKIQHYSRYTVKSPSIAERAIRSIRNLLENQCFKKEKQMG